MCCPELQAYLPRLGTSLKPVWLSRPVACGRSLGAEPPGHSGAGSDRNQTDRTAGSRWRWGAWRRSCIFGVAALRRARRGREPAGGDHHRATLARTPE